MINNSEDIELKRINKYLSESGFCSRRAADIIIDSGRVTIDGKIAVKGDKVLNRSVVLVDGKSISNKVKRIYLAFNKPVGITCTTDKRDPTNIVDYIKFKERIFPIGRLDKDSEGLLLLTNDGDIVNKILRSVNSHEKEYIVTVNKKISDGFLTGLSSGVPILDTITKKCYTQKTGEYEFKIILTQGLNRQIRRMCEYFDYRVVSLKRLRIMNIRLNELKSGEFRYLNEKELEILNNSLSKSIKN